MIRVLNKDYKQILDNIKDGTCITPDNAYGENKYNKQVKSLCDFLGFTKERFDTNSLLYKYNDNIVISYIYTKGEKEHTGFFKHLCQQIQSLGYKILIENPTSERIKEIMKKHHYNNMSDVILNLV